MSRLRAETSHQRARVDVNNSRVLAHGRAVHGDVGGCVGERRTRLVVETRHSRLVHRVRAEQLAVLHELRVEQQPTCEHVYELLVSCRCLVSRVRLYIVVGRVSCQVVFAVEEAQTHCVYSVTCRLLALRLLDLMEFKKRIILFFNSNLTILHLLTIYTSFKEH